MASRKASNENANQEGLMKEISENKKKLEDANTALVSQKQNTEKIIKKLKASISALFANQQSSNEQFAEVFEKFEKIKEKKKKQKNAIWI